jgi:hypothetical protein
MGCGEATTQSSTAWPASNPSGSPAGEWDLAYAPQYVGSNFPGGGPFKGTAFTAVTVAIFIILDVILTVRSRRNK